MNSRQIKNLRKKRRGKNAWVTTVAALTTVIFCVFSVIMVASVLALRGGRPGETEPPETVDTLGAVPPDTEPVAPPDDGAFFRVSDAQTLYLLADSDAFGTYFEQSGKEPVLIIEEDAEITLDRTLEIRSGIIMTVSGKLSFADESVKIKITADGHRKISILADAPISRYEIDAPESDLYLEGGDIPFLKEVAETQNVASYNGTPTAGAADGDTLGGPGNVRAVSATLYRDKKRTEKWTGAYSAVYGNLITLYVPHDVSDSDIKSLSVTIDAAEGGICSLPEKLDLSSPALVTVTDMTGAGRTYRLTVERARLDIPILELYTVGGSSIKSKTEYIKGTMILDGVDYPLSVKGRGNTSWHTFPKKSYRIKLDKKAKLLGMTADRDWCLIGNYVDPSLLRNKVASEMAKVMTGLAFTPSYRSVDLFINGEYRGVYMLSEKIEVDDDRLDLGESRVEDEDGKLTDLAFLLEFGLDISNPRTYGKDWFNTTYCKHVYINEPEIAKARNAEYKFIYNYVKSAEKAVISGENIENYLDLDSWVDWFIVNELANNTESSMFRSFFMYKAVGGKLTAGPIWDYDLAFGNHTADIKGYKGWASVDFVYSDMTDNWMKFLIKNEVFMSRLRERWAEMKGPLMAAAKSAIEAGAAEIEASQAYNFGVWRKVLTSRIMLARATRLGFKTWQEQVDYLYEFLDMRYAWMDSQLS